ncbi:MAG: DUF1631 family protein [Pseudomonadales bacterium]|nr:DUF1631 family protein [Pseudomonadales bacterium]
MRLEAVLEEAFSAKPEKMTEEAFSANKKAEQALFFALGQLHRDRLQGDDLQSLEQLITLNPDYAGKLTARSTNILKFTDLLFDAFVEDAGLDEELSDKLFLFRFVTAQSLLLDSGFFQDTAIFSLQLMDSIGEWLIGWTRALGKTAEKALQRLDTLAFLLGSVDDAISIERTVSTFNEATEKELNRAALLEKRVCESELGVMETRRARRTVDTLINRLTKGSSLRRHAILFIHGPLRDALYMLLLKHDAQSQEWKRAVKIVEELVVSLTPQNDATAKQRIYQIIPKLPQHLERLVGNVCTEADMEHWLGGLEELHMRVLRGLPLDTEELGCEEVVPLSFLDELNDINTSVSSALLAKAEAVQPGQWMIYTNDRGEDIRCKLALRLEETQQVLFVNAQGAKCLEKSLEEFAYDLSVQNFVLLESKQLMTRCKKQAIPDFIQYYRLEEEQKEQEQQLEKERQLAQEKAQREAEELAEKNRLANLQRMKMEKLEREKREREDKLREEERLQSQDSSEFEETYRKVCLFKIGSWFEFKTEQGIQKHKLAVLIASTKKLIFVNKTGVKVGTYSFDEFAHMMLEGNVILTEEADQFEHSLARVIKTLRKE